MEFAAELALRKEQHGNDAHGLLRVIAAMAERIERRRDELQMPKAAVDRIWRPAHQKPRQRQHQQDRKEKPDQRRRHDSQRRRHQACPHNGTNAGFRDAGAHQAADQRVRTARRNAQGPGDQVPKDRTHQRAEHHTRVDHGGRDDSGAKCIGHMQTEKQECDEIEEGRPGHRVLRRQHAGGDNGRDRIGRVVQPVQEIERECDRDQADQHRQRQHGVHLVLVPKRLTRHAR